MVSNGKILKDFDEIAYKTSDMQLLENFENLTPKTSQFHILLHFQNRNFGRVCCFTGQKADFVLLGLPLGGRPSPQKVPLVFIQSKTYDDCKMFKNTA